MGRRWALEEAHKEAILVGLDRMAHRLVAAGLEKEEASEAVAAAFGDFSEAVVESLGAPDLIGDAIGSLVERLVEAIADAVRPDPERLRLRAIKALEAGNAKRAARLMARAAKAAG